MMPGSIGYLISIQWILKYKKYVQYDSLRKKVMPQWDQSQSKPPGKITNADFLSIDSDVCLHGTGGTEKGTEAECIDRYIKKGAVENKHFEFCSAASWEFLSEKYGFDLEVKRYYQNGQLTLGATLEVKMKLVPLVLVYTDYLVRQEIS